MLFRELADQICQVEMPDNDVLVDIDTPAALYAVLTRFVTTYMSSAEKKLIACSAKDGPD